MNDLTLIIPAKDERESLPHVLEDLASIDCHITVTLKKDDQETVKSIKDKKINIFYQKGNGYGNALREAIENCSTKYFCIYNADGSFEKNDLLKMYDIMLNNDFVYATRYEKPGGSEDDTLITYIGNKIFSKMGNLFFSLKVTDILYTYVMGKTNSFKKLNIGSDDFKFCVELPIKMNHLNMKYECLPSYEKKRIAGKKKVNNIIDGYHILSEIIKLFYLFKILKRNK